MTAQGHSGELAGVVAFADIWPRSRRGRHLHLRTAFRSVLVHHRREGRRSPAPRASSVIFDQIQTFSARAASWAQPADVEQAQSVVAEV